MRKLHLVVYEPKTEYLPHFFWKFTEFQYEAYQQDTKDITGKENLQIFKTYEKNTVIFGVFLN